MAPHARAAWVAPLRRPLGLVSKQHPGLLSLHHMAALSSVNAWHAHVHFLSCCRHPFLLLLLLPGACRSGLGLSRAGAPETCSKSSFCSQRAS